MSKIIAVGDIHGCLTELKELHGKIKPVLDDDTYLVYLGDYIDRGPDSKGVVDELIQMEESHSKTIFLRGNHEDMMLNYLGYKGYYGTCWFHNGAMRTISSYSNGVEDFDLGDHLNFFLKLKYYHVIEDHLFVHAGVCTYKELDEQDNFDLLWIRDKFHYHDHCLPYVVVFGHTPVKSIGYGLPSKIAIDTGCVFGNKLSALLIDTDKKGLDRYTEFSVDSETGKPLVWS